MTQPLQKPLSEADHVVQSRIQRKLGGKELHPSDFNHQASRKVRCTACLFVFKFTLYHFDSHITHHQLNVRLCNRRSQGRARIRCELLCCNSFFSFFGHCINSRKLCGNCSVQLYHVCALYPLIVLCVRVDGFRCEFWGFV